jgi:hypothetical protein
VSARTHTEVAAAFLFYAALDLPASKSEGFA